MLRIKEIDYISDDIHVLKLEANGKMFFKQPQSVNAIEIFIL